MFVRLLLLATLLHRHSVKSLSKEDLYPFGSSPDQNLSPDVDDVSSFEIQLTVPIMFYGTSYSTIFVNDNGLLSFRTEVPAFFNAQFPLTYPIIAPLYSDVDTRGAGRVFYRETKAPELLERATRDIRQHFTQGNNFQAESLFIVTWDGVGHYNRGTAELNTFQVVITSNGEDSFTFLHYPEGGVQWIQGDGKNPNLPDARAQAGFMSGDGRLYTLRGSGTEQARNFDKMSNVRKPGVWMFHVGRTGSNGNILPGDLDIEKHEQQFCSNTLLPCPPSSECVDYDEGFCCVCRENYFGNGRNCLEKNVPQRMNGKVNGVINDIRLHDVDLHAYIVTEDGRTYTAISRVPSTLGYDLQSLTTLGGVIGWLFATPRSGALNGFMITGGTFNRSVEIEFPQTGHHVFIQEQHLGPDVFSYMRVNVELRGTLPSVLSGSRIEVSDYEEEFTRVSAGVIRSHTSRSYRLEGNALEVPFVIDQTINYNECIHAPIEYTGRLKVARNFIVYDGSEQIVRYAMTNKISLPTTEDPCKEGKFQCGSHSKCVVDGDSFRCVCDQGYEYFYEEDVNGERASCIDINECTAGRANCHFNAECINLPGNFMCRCLPGYIGDGIKCERLETCNDLNCDINAECVNHLNQAPVCRCRQGFRGDGYSCQPVDTEEGDCRRYHLCDVNADCVFNPNAQKYECQCRSDFYGDGTICTQQSCDIAYNCHPNAECLYNGNVGRHVCTCSHGFIGNGYDCVREDSFQNCNVINSCHPHAQCVYESHSGQYQCKCNAGYVGDGQHCSKSQEVGCDVVNVCSVYAHCVYDFFLSKHVCQCSDGYEGDGITCTAIDECNTVENCDINAQCVYDAYSQRYRCRCNHGFTGDGKSCSSQKDVTCDIVNNCSPDGQCVYDSISLEYRCQCNPGFNGDGITCQQAVVSCNIVNTCSVYADCSYDFGSQGHRCRCKFGYEGDGYTCRPTYSCEENPYLCDQNAECVRSDRSGASSCQCRQGFTGDGLSCSVSPQHDGNFLLFAQGMSLLRMPPFPSKTDRGKLLLMEPHQTAIALDIDCINGDVYWTDIYHQVIRKAHYNGTGAGVVLSQDIVSPEGLAIDWVSRNIYWTDSVKDTIEVSKLDGTERKKLISDGLSDPRGIAVHPGLGKMYWADWDRSAPRIETANMDGSSRSVFISENLGLPNMITVDFDRNDLCWTDSGLKRIECIGLHAQNRRVIYTPAAYPFGLAVLGGQIFWTDWEIKFVQRVDKNGGTAEPLEIPLGGSGKLFGIVAVPSYCPSVGNPCAVQNGGCRYLCLPDGKGYRTCVCPDVSEDESGDSSCNEV